jgi:hypothetical protein
VGRRPAHRGSVNVGQQRFLSLLGVSARYDGRVTEGGIPGSLSPFSSSAGGLPPLRIDRRALVCSVDARFGRSIFYPIKCRRGPSPLNRPSQSLSRAQQHYRGENRFTVITQYSMGEGSPDSKELVFLSFHPEVDAEQHLWIMNVQGWGLTQLTNTSQSEDQVYLASTSSHSP